MRSLFSRHAAHFLLLLSLFSLAVAVPCKDSTRPTYEVYHSVNGAQHTARASQLTQQGYRIISLSAYGEPENAQFAAVWVRRDGPAFEMAQGLDAKSFENWWTAWQAKGYVATHVSATGPAERATFAGVMEQISGAPFWALTCDLTNPYAFQNATVGHSMIVKSFRMYGTPQNRGYCVLGHENVGNVFNTVYYTTPSYNIDFGEVYQAELSKRFWRPSHLFVSEDHIITPVFTDTNIGSWSSFASLSASALDAEILAQKTNGLHPIHVQGAGSGVDTRFTAIFAKTDLSEQRTWTAKGSVDGFANNEQAKSNMDSLFRQWMQRNGVRQAQFAVSKNGTIVTERSFTFAEPSRARVEPDDKFFLSSVSKMFVNAAIVNLVQTGRLNYSTPAYPLLGFHQYGDARTANITVKHLLEHRAGYDRDKSGDPAFQFRMVALDLLQGSRTATIKDVIDWAIGRPLDFAPDASYAYSNYGTMVLSYIVEKVSGMEYLEFLQKNLLNGLDIALYKDGAAAHASDRISQETRVIGYDALHPLSTQRISGVYGGGGDIKKQTMGAFSLAGSASSIAKFVGSHAAYGYGDRQTSRRDGSVNGARAWVQSDKELDWAVTLNTRDFLSDWEWDNLVNYQVPSLFWTY
ncbi:unnamed protein product [Clonostachys solani]|uniref:Beta-lactamase-related domain-containing protein n=1 Tax=Clonostachys solani TaxID=160281 RepID=A0A9N9Z0J4_9HYPO|nr:unnamed protein product [Clonostachys solani]